MTRVLVVDDSPQILATLRLNLRARDYEVRVAPDGGRALAHAADWHPDLVILDLGLPDLDGVDVIRGLRGWTRVPIIVLSGRTDGGDKVDALDAGADDYVTKPFGVEELLARVRAVTRRAPVEGEEPPTVRVGSHTVDLVGKTVTGDDGGRVHLTPTEWGIVELLVRNPGRLIAQRRLLAEVWGPSHVKETHYLRVYLASLRRKLEADPSRPRHLITEPGMGYRFEP
ncbi:response regulator [Actinomadura kijaniata]|uniref:Two-component system KDP operon response regulator KdpE n=1 Tax=Actinomadura namibiensis TaxID=182080 RepID=A0A7W3LPI8_ACTNM|nr:response regulator [Actinomadura namibiensis]MBA8951966.1 two-component system KDP operon response regulator KdpE [Actinomadura namibiensis]